MMIRRLNALGTDEEVRYAPTDRRQPSLIRVAATGPGFRERKRLASALVSRRFRPLNNPWQPRGFAKLVIWSK